MMSLNLHLRALETEEQTEPEVSQGKEIARLT